MTPPFPHPHAHPTLQGPANSSCKPDLLIEPFWLRSWCRGGPCVLIGWARCLYLLWRIWCRLSVDLFPASCCTNRPWNKITWKCVVCKHHPFRPVDLRVHSAGDSTAKVVKQPRLWKEKRSAHWHRGSVSDVYTLDPKCSSACTHLSLLRRGNTHTRPTRFSWRRRLGKYFFPANRSSPFLFLQKNTKQKKLDNTAKQSKSFV